ncbi:MAG TPA: amidase [Candidatus Aquicultor sp.]|jgi:Asp-tRNA(Asn)/Glu-tRNA(Gln) amidotransferase A subunit family amidase
MLTESIFLDKSIAQIHEGYREKSIDPIEIANICINRIEELDCYYHAWVCFDKNKLMQQAAEVSCCALKGDVIRPLEGIPIAIKDIMNTQEFPTQMGSPLWKDFTPGNDARVVYYARNAGAIIPGKTETAEFAVHTLGNTLNPFDPLRTPGTSSSGSAVAIALGMVPVALGTQTAGSIVRPASFCGVYGCKPSFGLIPRTGMLKTTDSLDTIGFFAAYFEDLQRVFEALRVHGPNYPMSYNALRDTERQNKPANRPWKVALVRTHTWEYADNYAKEGLLNWAKALDCDHDIEIVDVDLPVIMERAHLVHATIYNKTLSYYFREEFKKSELVSPIMNDLIKQGNEITVAQYHQALEDQNELAHVMDEFFNDYDILISLSTAGEAPIREEVESPDPALMWTMTHLPVISAPVFTSPNGLPFGVQLVARRYNDYLLFKFADYLRLLNHVPANVDRLTGMKDTIKNKLSITSTLA